MNRKFFLVSAAAALVLGFNFSGNSSSSQPPAGHAGAPGEMNCTMCHSGTVNSGSGAIELVNPPANYTPGATYTMQVSVTDPAKSRFGFQLVALHANNQQAGTFTLVSAATTSLQTMGTKTYLSHRNASGTNTWTFTWQAPATNVGPVTFYMAGNGANGNNNTNGDNIYTSSHVLNPATNTGVKEDKAAAVKVFPSPASEKLNFAFPEKPKTVKVLDIAGREVHNQSKSETENAIDVSQYPNGTYFLQIEQKKSVMLKRFVVQH